MNKQRGGTLLGFVLGLLVGLGAALAVAVYITKVPIPFMSKVQGTADKEAEAKKNRDWDPNAGLSGKPAAKPADAPANPAPDAPAAPVPAPAGPQSGAAPDLLGDLAKARAEGKPSTTATTATTATAGTVPPAASVANDPFQYFVQAGAFRTPADAEQQRAKLTLIGVQARVSERDQSGRMVYRVRLGPYEKKDEADKAKEKLDGSGIEAVLVRVQK